MELAFSSGSQAQTHRQMCLPIARRQTHLQNLPLYPRHFPHTHSGMWLIHHPSTCRVSPTHTISCNSVPLLSFHFPTFFPMLLVLTIFSPVSFPHSINVQDCFFAEKSLLLSMGKNDENTSVVCYSSITSALTLNLGITYQSYQQVRTPNSHLSHASNITLELTKVFLPTITKQISSELLSVIFAFTVSKTFTK